ncbi:UDP-glucuronosyl/UDP-glucosyltransferase [Corchorus olitorius]|uniref:UDP-glucuronosyl/UDP-glucosyltransferase n=1 Tax=Corchorus olitorius TaxID=93759 RepID=A0A1R3KP18_9ROSI|nr:UDP-glucuronosyl/UDP-glucosyltransferase [Corchorus olitorius]
MMNKFHVVFISTPGSLGNLVPTVEFARHLTNHDRRFFATVLMIDMIQRPIITAYVESCRQSTATNINFINLPPTVDPPSPNEYQGFFGYMSLLVANHKHSVKHALANLIMSDSRVAGLFVDMFCTSMIDVANELGISCYLYFASPVSFLGFMLHFPTLDDTQFAMEFVDSDDGMMVPKDSTGSMKELGLGVEIRLDYREGSDDLVSPVELERALRRLMEGSEADEVRRKFQEMKEKSWMALMPNGSSYKSLTSLIEELIRN